ncbi:MAG: hypothetical protein JWM36_1210 [Hyphomicrobiales bacterium]|nr:hypothetical protein [Hyphomicrobiales bacterium]
MKYSLTVLVLSSIACIMSGSLASAQGTPNREDAIRQCISQAQGEVPNVSGDPNDPAYSRRLTIYAACMARFGERP